MKGGKRLVLRSKPLIKQKNHRRINRETSVAELCERLDYVLKRSEEIEAQLNNIEARKSSQSFETKNLTFGTPSVLKLNTMNSPMRKTEISMSYIDPPKRLTRNVSFREQKTPDNSNIIELIVSELNQLRDDVASVMKTQRELQLEIRELKQNYY